MTTRKRRRTRHASTINSVLTLTVAGFAAGCSNAPSAAPAPVETRPAVAQPAATRVDVPLRAGFVRLPNAVHPFAVPEHDTGRLAPERRLTSLSLFFKLTPEQRAARDALVAAQLDPASPEYHRWLTPESYAARFGARPEDVARASAWLRAQGFDVQRTSRLRTRVTFSATVAELEAAFQTELHSYEVAGEAHFAMATAPAFPADLAGIVLGLHNTHDFFKKPVSHARNDGAILRGRPDYKITYDAGADAGPDAGSFNVLAPPDWTAAYDVDRLHSGALGHAKLDGTGVTIGIVGTALVAPSDIDGFRTKWGIPALGSNLVITTVPGTGEAAEGRRGNGIEAILDLEWSGSIAPGAKINYVTVGADDRNVDDATFYLIEENLASVMSESYGGCEAGALPTDADVLEENGTAANLLGITYMAAAGDDGAQDCGGGFFGGYPGLYVDMPGSFPGVTSVGGTQFPSPPWTAAGNLTAYPTDEEVWNESNDPYSQFGLGAGGGGISTVFARPAYQSGVHTCAPVGSLPVPEQAAKFRQVPDVALSAASATPGYVVSCTPSAAGTDCSSTGGAPVEFPIGGTSASSPSFTGIVAILTQAAGERLGNINPMLYALETSSPTAFHDITKGTNEIACANAGAGDAGGPGDAGWADAGCGPQGLYGYPATAGYDCASGLGSIDGYNLVSALVATSVSKTVTALAAAPIAGVAPGQDVTLSASIALAGGATGSATLTGAVTFTFQSYTITGATDLSWELGTVKVDHATASTGDATLKTAIPPGLVKPGQQWVDVVAVYGGDATHLSSTSNKVGVGFEPLHFAIDPATATVQPNANENFTTTGGTQPIVWNVDLDTTAGRVTVDGGGFAFGAAGFIDGGLLSVGPKPGFVEISALDKNGIEAVARITVGSPDAGAPWAGDAQVFIDSGVAPAIDAGASASGGKDAGSVEDAGPARDSGGTRDSGATKDAGGGSADSGKVTPDAGRARDAGKDVEVDGGAAESTNSGGCNCEVRGAQKRGEHDAGGVVGGLLVGVAILGRRRKR